MAHDITKDVIGVKEFEVQDINISGEPARYHGTITRDADITHKKYVDDAIDAKIEDGDTTGQTTYWDDTANQWKKNSAVFWDAVNEKLGIGTSSPSTQAHIYDTITSGSGDSSFLRVEGYNGVVSRTVNIGILDNGISNTYSGIWFNQTSPDLTNYAFLNAGGNIINTPSGQWLAFRVANADIMRMTSAGLGIGTTTPNEKLHVVGKIEATTAFNINGTDGASGSFTSADGKTITVSGGIITSIV